MSHIPGLINNLLQKPRELSATSRYIVLNGIIYIAGGMFLMAWPASIQILFRHRAFVGDEQGLIRVIGLTVVVIGWFYLFGGRSGARQVVVASVIN